VSSSPDSTPKVIQGELDLRDSAWDLEQDGIIALNGDWEFFWQKLLTPGEVNHNYQSETHGYIQVPKIWGEQSINGKS
jgi:two-component system LytT family sensor kinase